MSNEKVQANYDELATVANRFDEQATAIEGHLQKVRQSVEALQRGGWVGQGADAFFAEMDDEVLPAVQRLATAMTDGRDTTQRVAQLFREAEEEAAGPFRTGDVDGQEKGKGETQFPMDYSRFDQALTYIHGEMLANAQNDRVKLIRSLLDRALHPQWYDYLGGGDPGTDIATALTLWWMEVHSGGPWDHKPKLAQMLDLGEANDYYFPIRGDDQHEYFYDIWSNIHYGYVGSAAGFTSGTLQGGAALGDWFTGVNDKGDEISVQIGIDLWNQYSTNLTAAQLQQAILDHTDDYLRVQQEAPDVRVVIQPRNGR